MKSLDLRQLNNLSDMVDLLELDLDKVYSDAAQGKIKLIYQVTENESVWVCNSLFLEKKKFIKTPSRNVAFYKNLFDTGFDFDGTLLEMKFLQYASCLSLNKEDCLLLKENGAAEIFCFDQSLLSDGDGVYVAEDAPVIFSRFENISLKDCPWLFVTCDALDDNQIFTKESIKKIPVTFRNLKITKEDIIKFFDSEENLKKRYEEIQFEIYVKEQIEIHFGLGVKITELPVELRKLYRIVLKMWLETTDGEYLDSKKLKEELDSIGLNTKYLPGVILYELYPENPDNQSRGGNNNKISSRASNSAHKFNGGEFNFYDSGVMGLFSAWELVESKIILPDEVENYLKDYWFYKRDAARRLPSLLKK